MIGPYRTTRNGTVWFNPRRVTSVNVSAGGEIHVRCGEDDGAWTLSRESAADIVADLTKAQEGGAG